MPPAEGVLMGPASEVYMSVLQPLDFMLNVFSFFEIMQLTRFQGLHQMFDPSCSCLDAPMPRCWTSAKPLQNQALSVRGDQDNACDGRASV